MNHKSSKKFHFEILTVAVGLIAFLIGSGQAPQPIAANPSITSPTFSLETFPNTEEYQRSEAIRVRYVDRNNRAIVTRTLVGLADDSVRAIRTTYEYEKVGVSSTGTILWQQRSVQEEYKCQPGRGQQNWSTDLCQ